jgi:hypothetical protein
MSNKNTVTGGQVVTFTFEPVGGLQHLHILNKHSI